jgi:NIMA (never in mitosis gene a)-related kinase
MLTLNPPFQADDFDGLYKKVIAGKYNKINSRYSEDMNEILKLLFKVNPKERPTCDELLKLDLIKKRIEFFKAEAGLDFNDIEALDDNELLKTIRISKNLVGLKDKLPKPNYSLPKIKTNNLNQTKTINNNNFHREALTTVDNNTNTNLTNHINTLNRKLDPFSYKINNKSTNNNNIFILKKVRLNSDQKELNERSHSKKLFNIFSAPRRNLNIPSRKNFEEKKNIHTNNKKKNNMLKDKKIYDTYKLYLSKEVRQFLSKNKRYNLPKININKNSQSSGIK